MSQNIFTAKHAQGPLVEGVCLTAKDGFSARYDLDRINCLLYTSPSPRD